VTALERAVIDAARALRAAQRHAVEGKPYGPQWLASSDARLDAIDAADAALRAAVDALDASGGAS